MPAAPTPIAGRYRLGESLGVGGMGQVWLARDEILDRDVAIKEIVLPAELIAADRAGVRQRTLREARAAARLSHPGVAQVYDVLEAGGRTWIVMEYVPSRSLQEVVKVDGPLTPRRAARIGLEVLAALKAAHRAGVWHRDVKPANVLLADDGRVVLTDFGIASIEGDGLVTGSGLVFGSPEYMSPERVQHGTAGPASDLWSLGATLYTAVEGHSPYKRASVVATLTALATSEPDPPRRAGALRPVLEGLLRKDPQSRIDIDEAERRLRVAAMAKVPQPRRRWRSERTYQAGRAEAAEWAGPLSPAQPPSEPAERATEAEEPDATAIRPAQPVPPPPPSPPPSEHATDVGFRDLRTPPAADTTSARPLSTRRNRRRATAVVAAMLTLAAVTWLATRSGPETPVGESPAPSTAGTTATASVAPSTLATVAPEGSAQVTGEASDAPRRSPVAARTVRPRPPLPRGWIDYRDTTGFSVYVPKGWNRSREGSMVYFRDPATGRVLGIDQTTKPASNPVADWRGKASYRVARGDFPGYDEIRIVSVRYWLKAADWEFTFNGRTSRQHVNNRGFVVAKDQAYGIWWQTRHADWAAARPDLQLVFDSFRPKR